DLGKSANAGPRSRTRWPPPKRWPYHCHRHGPLSARTPPMWPWPTVAGQCLTTRPPQGFIPPPPSWTKNNSSWTPPPNQLATDWTKTPLPSSWPKHAWLVAIPSATTKSRHAMLYSPRTLVYQQSLAQLELAKLLQCQQLKIFGNTTMAQHPSLGWLPQQLRPMY